MKAYIWRSFSSNNSSDYRLIARFKSAAKAKTACDELKVFMAQHAVEVDGREDWSEDLSQVQLDASEKLGIKWPDYPLYWGDEALEDNPPSVAIADQTVVVYHDYCGGLEQTLGAYLEALGAQLDPEESTSPTVAVTMTLPAGKAGEKVQGELVAFFSQAQAGANLSEWDKGPPWKTEHRLPYAEAEEVLYFSDGELAAFHLPMNTGDLDGLTAYLARRKVEDYRLLLCDDELKFKLRTLARAPRCPECRRSELKYLTAESEQLEEDQILCRACGGMFTLGAIAAASPVIELSEERLSSIRGIGDTVFCAGLGGSIFRSKAGGEFKRVKRHKGELYGVHMVSEKVVLAAGSLGAILRTDNGGTRWTEVKSGVKEYLLTFSRTPSGTIFLTGTGAILRSTDEGRTFKKTKVPVKFHMMHVDAVDDTLLFAVGHGGTVLRSRDGGLTWQKQKSVTDPLYRIKTFNAREAVAMGEAGVILTTSNGAQTWTRRRSKASGDIEDLAVGNDGRVYAVSGSGQVLISDNKGKKWTVEPSGTSKHLCGLWPSPSGVLMLVGDGGTLIRREELDVPLQASPAQEAAEAQALATVGKSFLFTGKLSNLTRAAAKARVKALEGVSKSSVTKDLDYLVVGDQGSPLFGQGKKGTKMVAAEKLIASGTKLQIISESAFMALEREG